MLNALTFWKFIGRRLQAGQAVMLLIVVESAGSSPGRAGFKMAVSADGQLSGSIGGGIMEHKLVELARQQLLQKATPWPMLKRQIHRQDAAQYRSGMICSGEQTVALLRLEATELPVLRRLIQCLKNNHKAILQFSQAGLDLQENPATGLSVCNKNQHDTNFIFSEYIGIKPRLHIVGGGHCGLALSRLMHALGFHICLYDDRPQLNTFIRNRYAHEKFALDDYEQIGDYMSAGPDVYLVVMTMGYRSDAAVIRQLLDRDFVYFGVLGSSSKMETLLLQLETEGYSPTRLRQLYTPIGLRINSRTPAEIAVSIAAEIIAVKNKR